MLSGVSQKQINKKIPANPDTWSEVAGTLKGAEGQKTFNNSHLVLNSYCSEPGPFPGAQRELCVSREGRNHRREHRGGAVCICLAGEGKPGEGLI